MKPPVVIDLTEPRLLCPTPEEVLQVLAGNFVIRERTARAQHDAPSFRNVGSYLQLSEANGGKAIPPSFLRDRVAEYDWRELFGRLAFIAALMANRPHDGPDIPPDVRRIIHDPLVAGRDSLNPAHHAVALYVAAHPSRPVVHEQVLYLLEALAILVGAENGSAPDDHTLALLLLSANDYFLQWQEPDSRDLTDLERVTAEFCRIARFNQGKDPLRRIAHTHLIHSQVPTQGPLADPELRRLVQERAFGESFDDFFSDFVLPLLFESGSWGREAVGGLLKGPLVSPTRWYSETKVDKDEAQAFLRSLTTSRSAAQAELSKRLTPDGLPHSPSLFVRTPFVEVGPDKLCASSPSMVHEQLRGGLYMRLSQACKDSPELPKDTWPRAFGHQFELACRELAQVAARSSDFPARLHLSREVGSEDEIEDVVLEERGAFALFSPRGGSSRRTSPETPSREAS